MKSIKIVLIMIVLLFSTIIAHAEVTKVMNFQARLTDSDGTPLSTNSYSLDFSIFNVETGGTAIWQETQTLYVEDGICNALLGANTPFDAAMFENDCWLEVTIEDSESLPRQLIAPTGYSFNSGMLGGIPANDYLLRLDGSEDRDFVINGSAIINRSTPGQALHVKGVNAAFRVEPFADGYSLCEIGENERAIIRFGIENSAGNALMHGSLANAAVLSARYDSALQFGTQITPRMTIDTNGNVGIGTATPRSLLHIAGGDLLLDRDANLQLVTSSGAINNVFGVNDSDQLTVGGGGNILGMLLDVRGGDPEIYINPAGNVGIGTTKQISKLHVSNGDLRQSSNVNSSASYVIQLTKSRGTASEPTIVKKGDNFGAYLFKGYDGTNYLEGARVLGSCDGDPGKNDMPGRLSFWTAADGVSTVTERMRIDNAGNVGIGTTNPKTRLDLGDNGTLLITEPNITETRLQYNGLRMKNIYDPVDKTKDGWARGLLTYTDKDDVPYFCIGGYGRSQDCAYYWFGPNWHETDLRIYPGTSATFQHDVGIGVVTPKAELDVNGRIVGGFGAASTGGVLNWNDGSNARSGSGFSLLSGTAPGGPGPGTLFHPFTFEYKNKDGNGNVTQFAIPYGKEDHCGNIYYRGRFSKAWTPKWRKIVAEINGIATIGTSAKSANLRVNGDIYATGNIEGHDFIFRDKETDKVLWRMVEDEKGLYLIKECNGKKYRIMMEEME